jgi:hypothetical protein
MPPLRLKVTFTPSDFRAACLWHFDYLIRDFGFKEESVPEQKFLVSFVSLTTRIVVEGFNYGFAIDIRLSDVDPTKMQYKSYAFGDLLSLKGIKITLPYHEGETLSGEVQVRQMKVYAPALREYASDVLLGDRSVFPSLADCITQRRNQIESPVPKKRFLPLL